MAIIPILAQPFNLDEASIEKALDDVAKDAQKDYQRFANSMDSILSRIQIIESTGERLVIPKRDRDGQILSYVVSGTSVRFATMTDDFRPRTTPGSLRVKGKQGGVAYVNTAIPRPGIEARDTHELLAGKYSVILQRKIKKALDL